MPSEPSSKQLGEAVLNSISKGIYPDSEDVISAELRPSAFSIVLELLEDARRELKDHIRNEIRHVSPNVDEWIVDAKQLHADIKASEEEAREISRAALEGEERQDQVRDAANKRRLLREELDYNATLVEILETINGIKGTLDIADERVDADHFSEAIDMLNDCEAQLDPLKEIHASTALELVRARITGIRWTILNRIDRYWDTLIVFKPEKRRVEIRRNEQGGSLSDLPALASALEKLGVLNSKLEEFLENLGKVILSPLLEPHLKAEEAGVTIQENTIKVIKSQEPINVKGLLDDLNDVIRFLSTHLPSTFTIPLSQVLIPNITSKLISPWLSDDVPSTLEGLPDFSETVVRVIAFRHTIHSLGWQGEGDLTDWIENTPQVWLSKRRETSLDMVRETLSGGFGECKKVERVETERLAPGDGLLAANLTNHQDTAGSEDAKGQSGNGHQTHSGGDEEEDVSAWGLDEDVADENQESVLESTNTVLEEIVRPSQAPNADRELVLRETYTITKTPESILDLIEQLVQDADNLAASRSNATYSSVAPASAGLTSLPSLILAMYRASSPYHYSKHVSGNMFLYNDSLWLAEQLSRIDETPRSGGSLKFQSDVIVLENFGKHAYKKEMESQRNTLRDLLARAHGFVNCTAEPFASECNNAVNAIVDRIRRLNDHWKPVLSQSALLQSLGSLLSTVINTIIIDIEDMNDISEVESQQLTRFCNRISNLEDLFLPTHDIPDSSEQASQPDVPLTAVYAPNWLRFQFLANILESSLADIRYMWTEGELRLEFSAEEIVDLIEALFVDSEHRRRTISAIRRSSTGSG
ncbi:MAG: hypothetical protein M1816_005813 [Peltula sp. TS41687]|nr:MAG: hypothetical protein M1816_005813 [Peltula sp. TS41687]